MQIGTSGHTVIIGAGVIGAAIGQSLVSRGQSVTVIERGLIAAKPGASGASAALLEPLAGAHPELRDTAQRALARLPGLCRDLLADTGIDPQWSRPGSMVLVSRERDATWLRTFRMPMFHEIGEPVEWLTGHQARVLEPAIGSHVVGALLIPSTQSVHAPGYVRALIADVSRRGGVVLAETVVTGFRRDGLTVRAVVTSAGEILCDRVVIACGAWSGHVASLLGNDVPAVPISPQRGQILAIAPTGGAPRVSHVLHGAGGYAVPKPNGTVLVGATHDNVGFDQSLTPEGFRFLGTLAHDLVPGIADEPVRHVWAGFRPIWEGSGPPPVGPLPGTDNVIIAAGHGAIGLTVSAGVGEVVADLVTGR